MRIIDPPGGKPWALLALCSASVLLNVVLLVRGGPDAPEAVELAEVADEAAEDAVADAVIAEPALAEDQAQPALDAMAAPDKPLVPDGVHVTTARVEHSLARTFQKAEPERGDVVSAIYARLFFWDLNLRSDLQAGDRVAVAYTWDGELADISAATYESKKLGHLTAFQFKATGDDYPSYWREDGSEAALRLKVGPLNQYEQVTSLLKDRPTHKGMDFKTPVGTPVVSPKAGKITRTDWNWKYNGNCIEVRYNDGVTARFLHLSQTKVEAGQTVRAGQRIGATGNTGRSTAPHLHYEIDRSGRTLDPVDYHGTHRRSLPEGDHGAFGEVKSHWMGLLATDA